MSNPALTFRFPDLIVDFPWPRNLSEHHREAKAESSAWVESYHPFDEEGLRGFNRCDASAYILPSVQLLRLIDSPGRPPCCIVVLSSREGSVTLAPFPAPSKPTSSARNHPHRLRLDEPIFCHTNTPTLSMGKALVKSVTLSWMHFATQKSSTQKESSHSVK